MSNSGNIYFDFDTMGSIATSKMLCSTTILGQALDAVHILKINLNGAFDLKKSNLLGLKEKYKVYAKGTMTSQKYTGENLGNRLYGFMCAKAGISLKKTINAPAAFEYNTSDQKDNNDIYSGWLYGKGCFWDDYVFSKNLIK